MTQPGSIIAPQPGWWVRTDRIGTNTSQYGWTAAVAGPAQGIATGSYGWAADAAGERTPEILAEVVGEVVTSTAVLNLSPAAVHETVTETGHVVAGLNTHGAAAVARSITDTVTPGLARTTHAAVARSITGTVTPGLTKFSPPSYDSTGAAFTGSGLTPSWTHTIGAGANCVFAAFAVAVNSGSFTGITAKVGSTSMSLVRSIEYFASGGSFLELYVFKLMNPPTGAQTISGTITATGTVFGAANSVAYKDVAALGAPATAGPGLNASSANPSQTVSSGTGQMVFQAIGGDAANFSAYTKTQRYNATYHAGVNIPLLLGDAAGAASVIFGATATSDLWAAIAVPLI